MSARNASEQKFLSRVDNTRRRDREHSTAVFVFLKMNEYEQAREIRGRRENVSRKVILRMTMVNNNWKELHPLKK